MPVSRQWVCVPALVALIKMGARRLDGGGRFKWSWRQENQSKGMRDLGGGGGGDKSEERRK